MENEAAGLFIDGAFVWQTIVSVGILLLGNAIRVKSAEAAEERRQIKGITDRLLVVETKMVEETRVREIIHECVADIKEGQTEIRNDIKGLSSEIHELAQMMATHNLNG